MKRAVAEVRLKKFELHRIYDDSFKMAEISSFSTLKQNKKVL